jgi:hypothetical protein
LLLILLILLYFDAGGQETRLYAIELLRHQRRLKCEC